MNTLDYIIKKYDIDLDGRYVIEIPNMGRDNMAELFAELNFNKGAEIGVFKGKYSKVLCSKNSNLILYGVDPWKLDAHADGVFIRGEKQELFDRFYKEAKNRLALFKNFVYVKKLSMDALDDFEDQSLDFVYIDAGHDFINVAQDLHYWQKKIRIGGIISGHDYARYPFKKLIHVKRVLEAYVWSYKCLPLFVVGRDEVREGEVRDKFRSWFFVKEKHYD